MRYERTAVKYSPGYFTFVNSSLVIQRCCRVIQTVKVESVLYWYKVDNMIVHHAMFVDCICKTGVYEEELVLFCNK